MAIVIRGLQSFDWDDDKARLNLAKHNVSFDIAICIFDHWVLTQIDDRHDYGELRMVAIGMVAGRELSVVYTDRGDIRRIISARRANRHERKLFNRERPS